MRLEMQSYIEAKTWQQLMNGICFIDESIKDLRCGVSEKTINNVVKKVNKDFTLLRV